jgi:DNA-binding response OmpR family regulator
VNLALFPHKRARETNGATTLPESRPPVAIRADITAGDTAPLRILVAGAAPSVALLAQTLGKAAHIIAYVADDTTVQQRAISGAYDLLVLDVALPSLGGLETCRRLRAAGVGALIVFYGTSRSVDDVVAALDAGADDLLHNAIAPEEARARLLALLRRKGRAYAPDRLPSSKPNAGLPARAMYPAR